MPIFHRFPQQSGNLPLGYPIYTALSNPRHHLLQPLPLPWQFVTLTARPLPDCTCSACQLVTAHGQSQVQFFPPTMMDARSNTDNQNAQEVVCLTLHLFSCSKRSSTMCAFWLSSRLAQDGHFFWQVGGRLLPPADLVRRFNAG